jgi:hypothetical protein
LAGEIIALDQAQELSDLIGLRLAFDILQIDQFWHGWMDVDMMATVDTGELESERFCAGNRISKADIF